VLSRASYLGAAIECEVEIGQAQVLKALVPVTADVGRGASVWATLAADEIMAFEHRSAEAADS